MMKKIRIEQAVGMVLGHDVTQIIPGKYKGPRFRRGHRIKKEDIPKFLEIGKDHVFVMRLKAGIIHEDEAALRLGRAFPGGNIDITGPSEGKVTFYSKISGVLYPNPDIEKVHVADRPGLERFFKRRIPDSSNWLPNPDQERTAPLGHGHSLDFGQTTPLASSLVRCIRPLFHPSGQTLSSKDFFLTP